jgi:hypothetical protein
MFDFIPPIVLQAILIAVPAIVAYLYVKRVRSSAQYLQMQKQNSVKPTGDQSGGKDK